MSHSQLHAHHLKNFEEWLKARGWVMEDASGTYEALRMTSKDYDEPLVIYRRQDDRDQLTVTGPGELLVMQFKKDKKL